MKYYYYEEGKTETFTETELQNYFENTAALNKQKRQGTTYETWKDEMIHMQILCPVTERYIIGQDFNTKDWFIYDSIMSRNVCWCQTETEAKKYVLGLTTNDISKNERK